MEGKGWRARMSRCFDRNTPPELQPIDNEIVKLGGTTSASNLSHSQLQAQKSAVSIEQRIMELVEDNRRLAYEREYFDRLTENTMSILPQVVYHVEALSVSTRKYIARVDRVKVRKETLNEARFGVTPLTPSTAQGSPPKRATRA